MHVILLTSTPIIALFGLLTWTFNWRTFSFAVFYYFVSGLGITAGYHRHFSHKAYKATQSCKLLLLLMAAAAVEGSCRWWSRGHRAHHRYVDTDMDPYAVVKGFWHAHIGWMFVKQDPKKIGIVDIEDLDQDPLVKKNGLFNKYYPLIALFMGFVLPTLVCGYFWNDWYGGYFVAGVARLVFVHHSTFFVNSLAHYAGSATYTDGHTARNSVITAFLTLGEGYHNFHHEFPSDYRNGVEWWQYDPTKHFIYALSLFGLAYDLQTFPQNEIDKGMYQMEQKELNAKKRKAFWGPDPKDVPVMTRGEFNEKVKRGDKLVILDGFVLDIEDFLPEHPGSEKILLRKIGKDITLDFSLHEREATPTDEPEFQRPAEKKKESDAKKMVVGFYKHSNAARSFAETFRVARIDGYHISASAPPISLQASALLAGSGQLDKKRM